MEREISYVKQMRMKLGLTQNELSKLSGVSQSMITKIEAGLVDPTYTVAKKIFSALDLKSKKDMHTANDVLNRNVLFCFQDDDIKSVVVTMKKHAISQLPVLDDKHHIVGSITENVVLNNMDKILGKDTKVKDIMQETVPVVTRNTSLVAVTHLLKDFPFVLVSDKGKYMGIITKSDLISGMYK